MTVKKQYKKVPKSLQWVLWSADVNHLDLDRDRNYIIHQILTVGSFPELKWLFAHYSKKEVIDVFINHPIKMYPRVVFYFVKNYLLKLKNKFLDEDRYTTSIHGPVKPRAAGSL